MRKVVLGLSLSVVWSAWTGTAVAMPVVQAAGAVEPGTGRVVAVASSPAADAELVRLTADLHRSLRVPGWSSDAWGVLVVSLDHGDTLFARSPDAPLAPASNMKLFTSAAALYYLGPDFRYHTFLLADGAVEDGVLEGDLILYGTGDPTLSSRSAGVWQAFADSVFAMGIREVTGDIVADASYFTGPSSGTGWRSTYIDAAYAAPANALTLNENLVTVHVYPGSTPGEPARVRTDPGGDVAWVVNYATTTSGSTQIRIGRSTYDGPVEVTGRIATNSTGVSRVVPVADADLYAAAVLRQALEERGIRVAGGIRGVADAAESRLSTRRAFAPTFDPAPAPRILAVHRSPPLIEILETVNKNSHNLFAEQVLRTVGRVVLGEGSAAAGIRAVQYFLECEIGAVDLDIYDGSGLSPLNRTTARTVVRLLAFMADSPVWESFWETLPEAGTRRDGLRRMERTPAANNLRAKTGTINQVSALSGYVRTADGERLAFSILSNNVPSTWRAKRVEDEIGARLAAFTRPVPDIIQAGEVAPAELAPPVGASRE